MLVAVVDLEIAYEKYISNHSYEALAECNDSVLWR